MVDSHKILLPAVSSGNIWWAKKNWQNAFSTSVLSLMPCCYEVLLVWSISECLNTCKYMSTVLAFFSFVLGPITTFRLQFHGTVHHMCWPNSLHSFHSSVTNYPLCIFVPETGRCTLALLLASEAPMLKQGSDCLRNVINFLPLIVPVCSPGSF